MFRCALACCLGIALVGVSPASQNPPGTSINKPAVEPQQFDAVFNNSSKIRMTLQVAHVEIETIYGKLTVPFKDIRSIEFGAALRPA